MKLSWTSELDKWIEEKVFKKFDKWVNEAIQTTDVYT